MNPPMDVQSCFLEQSFQKASLITVIASATCLMRNTLSQLWKWLN